jgi:chaperone required for assembly of F1-ATPase
MKVPAKAPIADAARVKRKTSLPKRFYKDVAIEHEGARARLLLDGKPVRTPRKTPLVLPNATLGEDIAEEWRGQGARIDPETMLLTKLANSALDGVKGREGAVIDDMLAHAGSDLVCYRAEGPEGLVASQTEHWDPVLAWAKEALAAPLVLAQGVTHVDQPRASLEQTRRRLEGFDAFSLAALHDMAALTGSPLLALAVALGRLSPEEAWKAAHVDEDWQISQWGEDAQAATRRARRWRDFAAAARMLRLVQA